MANAAGSAVVTPTLQEDNDYRRFMTASLETLLRKWLEETCPLHPYVERLLRLSHWADTDLKNWRQMELDLDIKFPDEYIAAYEQWRIDQIVHQLHLAPNPNRFDSGIDVRTPIQTDDS